MSVKIRFESASPAEIDTVEAVLRQVLDIPGAASEDYPNFRHRRAQPGAPVRYRRYVDADGPLSTDMESAGRRSPLAEADDAKRSRDAAGEIGALVGGYEALMGQPWMPLLGGDVVLWRASNLDAGTTYVADDTETDEAGARLRTVSATGLVGAAGDPGFGLESFVDVWFESNPADLTVVRAGAVVYGRPTVGRP